MDLNTLTTEILNGKKITKEEAHLLYKEPLEILCEKANQIRIHFCKNQFDLCAIINAKSGHCSENCKFCAQSIYHRTQIKTYPLLSGEQIFSEAERNSEAGILRYSIVTSGKRLSEIEIDKICEVIKTIKEKLGIQVCVSLGLLNKEQFQKLKEAGVTRIHNNLETGRKNFPNICTTHHFDDKIRTIKEAQSVGLEVCSGGIFGIGESTEDRIDMAFTLRELNIKSVPINILNPIPGTSYGESEILKNSDLRRIVALYRFILPKASIRLAGGRGLLSDKGESCFLSGANAAISGDMLTTCGISAETDTKMLQSLGFEIHL